MKDSVSKGFCSHKERGEILNQRSSFFYISLLILTLALTNKPVSCQGVSSVEVPVTDLFVPQFCPFDKIKAPLELVGKMEFDDYVVTPEF